MTQFWLSFIVTEAIGVAQAFVGMASIKPGIKTALENFITSGAALTTAIQAGQ